MHFNDVSWHRFKHPRYMIICVRHLSPCKICNWSNWPYSTDCPWNLVKYELMWCFSKTRFLWRHWMTSKIIGHLKGEEVPPCDQAQSNLVSPTFKKAFHIYCLWKALLIYYKFETCHYLALQSRAQFSTCSRVPTWQHRLFSQF